MQYSQSNLDDSSGSGEGERVQKPQCISLFCCPLQDIRLSESHSPGCVTAILWLYGVPAGGHIQELYTGMECHVRTADGVSENFQVKTGVRQACVLSPLLFNCVMDRILKEATDLLEGGLNIEYTSAESLPLILKHNHSLHMHQKRAVR